MTRASTSLSLTALALLAGCATRPPVHINTGGPRDKSGQVVDDRLVAYIKPGQLVESAGDVLLHATQPGASAPDYWVLFGPSPGSATGSRGKVTLHSSVTTLEAHSGYALIWGVWPIAIDDVIDIGSDSLLKATSSLTVIFQSDSNRHRVFMLDNPDSVSLPVRVTATPNVTIPLVRPGTYVEAKFDDTGKWVLTGPANTADSAEATAYVKAVKAKAIAAGFAADALE